MTPTPTVESILRTNHSIRRWHTGWKINWSKPPKPTTIVRFLHQGRTYKMSFRTACAMARLNNLARNRFGKEIRIIQSCYNTGVSASAGTHDYDATFDLEIPGVPWREQERFFRANGFGCWYRYPPKFSHHIHGFVLPPREGQSISDDFKVHGFKVGKYVDGGFSLYGRLVTSSQLGDYYAHAFGLSGMHTPGSDRAWYPENIAATIFDHKAFIARRVKDAERAAALRARLKAAARR